MGRHLGHGPKVGIRKKRHSVENMRKIIKKLKMHTCPENGKTAAENPEICGKPGRKSQKIQMSKEKVGKISKKIKNEHSSRKRQNTSPLSNTKDIFFLVLSNTILFPTIYNNFLFVLTHTMNTFYFCESTEREIGERRNNSPVLPNFSLSPFKSIQLPLLFPNKYLLTNETLIDMNQKGLKG
jgi:hypothetical protein